MKYRMLHLLGDTRAGFDIVVAVHQYLRLDDRHQALFLAERHGVHRNSLRARDVGAGYIHPLEALLDGAGIFVRGQNARPGTVSSAIVFSS